MAPDGDGIERVDAERRFVWDGASILHEVSSDTGLTTWYWEPGTFTPVSKEHDGCQWSIASDHLGTPTEMYDTDGNAVWRMELDSYGVPAFDLGSAEDCPWRWPGQYQDTDVEEYYNRWRWYDPQSCRYISPDPIGWFLPPYRYVDDPIRWYDPLGLLGEWGVAPYQNIRHRGDGLDAHELLQNQWLQENTGSQRGRGTASRRNPAIALDPEFHARVTNAQRAAGLFDPSVIRSQTAVQNILANAAVFEREMAAELVRRGVSPDIAAARARRATARLRRSAMRHAERIGCT